MSEIEDHRRTLAGIEARREAILQEIDEARYLVARIQAEPHKTHAQRAELIMLQEKLGRLRHALRDANSEHLVVNRAIARLVRSDNASKRPLVAPFAESFMRVARESLPPETFDAIRREAVRRVDEASRAEGGPGEE